MIRVQGLTKRFNSITIIDNITFSLSPKESIAVLGPSGSGKTTLLRLIAGLERPDRGEIHIGGRPVSDPKRMVPPHERAVGFVFQEPALWPHFTVARNILFGLKHLPRRAARRMLSEILEATGLTGLEGRYPDEISGGEARRVSIARAIAPGPSCLLMDEPLVNLDAALKDRILRLILEIAEHRQVNMIYVTHDLSEAHRISGRILCLRNGSLREQAADGPTGE